MQYKNILQGKQQNLGQSRARLLGQYGNSLNAGLNNYAQLQGAGQNSFSQGKGQNSFSQRGGLAGGGAGSGLTSASSSQFPAYDYSDYPSAVGASAGGMYNRRMGGLSGYGNLGMSGYG